MKTFRCGDVVPDCTTVFTGEEGQILAAVAGHARRDHGLTDVSPELVNAVRRNIHTVA